MRSTLIVVLRGFLRLGPRTRRRKIRAMAKEAGLIAFVIVLSLGVLSLSKTEPEQALPTPIVTSTSEQPAPPPPPPPTLAGTGRLFLDGPAPISTAVYSPTPAVDPLEPSATGLNDVQWVDGLGVPPADAAAGTVFLIGHSWSQSGYALNGLSEFVTARTDFSAPSPRLPSQSIQGSTLSLVDAAGITVRWTVDTVFLISKSAMTGDTDIFRSHAPGRVVLITCAITADKDLDYNVVLIGHRQESAVGTMRDR